MYKLKLDWNVGNTFWQKVRKGSRTTRWSDGLGLRTRSKGSVNLPQGSVNLVVLCKVY